MRRRMLLVGALAVIAVSAVLVSGASGSAGSMQSRWVIRDLGKWKPTAINARGDIVGSRATSKCGGQPVLWRNGRITVVTARGDCGVANAVNDRGQVVGRHKLLFPWAAFLWRGGTITELGDKSSISAASDVDSHGRVVGTSAYYLGGRDSEDEDPSTWNEPRAWLWRDGKMTGLGTLGGNASIARAVNDVGQVVGESTTKSNRTHAFLSQSGKMVDLGTLAGATSRATAVNGRGQVVGCASITARTDHAFLWQNGTMRDLGTLDNTSKAVAVNDQGQVIGWSDAKDGWRHAVLWTLRSG